jgi:hypothetical protein
MHAKQQGSKGHMTATPLSAYQETLGMIYFARMLEYFEYDEGRKA